METVPTSTPSLHKAASLDLGTTGFPTETTNQRGRTISFDTSTCKLPVAHEIATSSSSPEHTTHTTTEECQVCLDEVPQSLILKELCGPKCPLVACKSCASSHFEGIVSESYDGILRKMTCPSCISMEVPSSTWANFTDPEMLALFQRRAAILLSLQCAGCHTRKDLFIQDQSLPTDADKHMEGIETMLVASEKRDAFTQALGLFTSGSINEEDFFQLICITLFPDQFQSSSPDEGPWEDVMKPILLSIRDARQRAVLHLRYLRSFPKCSTPCCKRVQCFRCRTGQWHEGQTCSQVLAAQFQNSEVLTCPACAIQLVKGDGCSSVTCVCGKTFNWDQRKKECVAETFRDLYGDSAGRMAALMFIRPAEFDAERVALSENWGQFFPDQAEAGRALLWEELHGHNAAAACRAVLKIGLIASDSTCWPSTAQVLARDWRKKTADSEARITSLTRAVRAASGRAVQKLYDIGAPAPALLSCTSKHSAQNIWPGVFGKVASSSVISWEDIFAQNQLAKSRSVRTWKFLYPGKSPHPSTLPSQHRALGEAFLSRQLYLQDVVAVGAFSLQYDQPLLSAMSMIEHPEKHSAEKVASAEMYLLAKRLALRKYLAGQWQKRFGPAVAPFAAHSLMARPAAAAELGGFPRRCLEAWAQEHGAALGEAAAAGRRARRAALAALLPGPDALLPLLRRHPALLRACAATAGPATAASAPPALPEVPEHAQHERERRDAAAFDLLYGPRALGSSAPVAPEHEAYLAAWRRLRAGAEGERALRFLDRGFAAGDRPGLARRTWRELARPPAAAAPGDLVAVQGLLDGGGGGGGGPCGRGFYLGAAGPRAAGGREAEDGVVAVWEVAGPLRRGQAGLFLWVEAAGGEWGDVVRLRRPSDGLCLARVPGGRGGGGGGGVGGVRFLPRRPGAAQQWVLERHRDPRGPSGDRLVDLEKTVCLAIVRVAPNGDGNGVCAPQASVPRPAVRLVRYDGGAPAEEQMLRFEVLPQEWGAASAAAAPLSTTQRAGRATDTAPRPLQRTRLSLRAQSAERPPWR